MARPILLVAPVTSAVFPSSRVPMGGLLLVVVDGEWTLRSRSVAEEMDPRVQNLPYTGDRAHGHETDPEGSRHPGAHCGQLCGPGALRGVGGTTLDDIRAGTATSKSQLFHYFPGGKAELVGAIASFQGERVLDAQRPYLDSLDSWEAWEGWRRAVLEHYGSQAHWGCPISAFGARGDRQ